VLDRLEAAGHVLRGPDPSDRRKVGLTMAATATELGEQFFRPLANELTAAWAEFTEAQRETIARFLMLSIEATIRVRGTTAR
jgi:DNA-binding MarR family transcriptional regulator